MDIHPHRRDWTCPHDHESKVAPFFPGYIKNFMNPNSTCIPRSPPWSSTINNSNKNSGNNDTKNDRASASVGPPITNGSILNGDTNPGSHKNPPNTSSLARLDYEDISPNNLNLSSQAPMWPLGSQQKIFSSQEDASISSPLGLFSSNTNNKLGTDSRMPLQPTVSLSSDQPSPLAYSSSSLIASSQEESSPSLQSPSTLSTSLSNMPRTGVVFDDRLLYHENLFADHPENPSRVQVIEDALEAQGLLKRVLQVPARIATDAEIMTVHEQDYVSWLLSTASIIYYKVLRVHRAVYLAN